jgi:hypothetical protein
MIDDLSKTLRAILTHPSVPPELAAAQILFDRPSETFSPQQTTINLFLYDIRENAELRSNEPEMVRKNGEIATYRPPLRLACSYLATAWPVGGVELALQEHRLLSQVLQEFAKLTIVPAEFLQGDLKTQTRPLPVATAVVDPQRNLSEFWTALGSRLRPAVTVTATIAMDLTPPQIAKMVTATELKLGLRTLGG